MKSIREQLQILAQLNNDSSKQIIAKEILANLDQGIIKRQADLSQQIYISCSVLTQFAKQFSFSGYREFVIQLRIEAEKYGYLKNKIKIIGHNTNNFFDFKKTFINDIISYDIYENEINDICKLLVNHKNAYFFSAYQLHSEVNFFQQILLIKNIRCIFVTYRVIDIKLSTKINDNAPIFFFVAGQDNTFLIYLYKTIIETIIPKYHNQIILFTTSSQADKMPVYNHQIIFNQKIEHDRFFYRRIYLEYLFLQIFNLLP